LTLGLLTEKVVAETAMLLVCVESIQAVDSSLRTRVDSIARLLAPHARSETVLSAICLDPGLARDHAVAHAILSRLGLPDPDVDHLLLESLAVGPMFGPERLPHRQLEQQWLQRVWSGGVAKSGPDDELVTLSMLGRPLDTLASTRDDLYAFTHSVMYWSDLGARRPDPPRPAPDIAADAEAGLAYSLDRDDFDLTAELLLTWPMLGLAWSPAATFAFGLLASVEDDLGFLPGSAFDLARYEALRGEEQSLYALLTSYHTGYVMGFLCAAALRPGCAPPAGVAPASGSQGAGQALFRQTVAADAKPRWKEAFIALAPAQQDSIAELLLAAVLRRAASCGDLRLLHDALQLAVQHNVIDGPAPRQAVALLRRCTALGAATKQRA